MFKSMTAFGRGHFSSTAGHFTVELQSTNRKFLDVTVNLPKELAHFEVEIKKWLIHHVARGHVSVKITVSFEQSIPFNVRPNLPLARQFQQAWSQIAEELNLDSSDFNLSLLSSVEGLFSYDDNLQEEETYRHALKSAFDEALHGFLKMKSKEGAVLLHDVLNRTASIRNWMRGVEAKGPQCALRYKERLEARLSDLHSVHLDTDERILKEIALYADKIDITEEVTRFFCHLDHLEEMINSSQASVGKVLEFILQELGREINTIGSKSADIEIARYTIDIKSELERIREQIQNVE